MKNLLFILFFLVSILSHGQSKKELNATYRMEESRLKASYDSCATVYVASEKQLEQLRKNVRAQLRYLDEQKRLALQKYDLIGRQNQKLIALGYDVNSLISYEEMRTDIIPKYQNISQYNEKLFSEVFYFKVVRDTLHLEELKIKQQNPLLMDQIGRYKTAQPINTEIIKREQLSIRQLDSITHSLDSIKQQMDGVNLYYQTKYKVLENKLKELEKNYQLKGPKGFSEAYAREFPDAFPEPFKIGDSGDYLRGNMEGNNAKTNSGDGVFDVAPYTPPTPAKKDEITIYEIVEELAEFPGGYTAAKEYLAKNMVYPPTAKELEIQGKCYLKFLVSEKGKISNVKVQRGVPDCPECDAEAVRLIKAMPDWTPGKIDGKPVNQLYTMIVPFKLN